MTQFLRSLFFLIAAAIIAATPARAQRTDAKVQVKLVKPLVITHSQDLDFGTIIHQAGAGTLVVTIGQNGSLTCPAPLTCMGTPLPAQYNVSGSNRVDVRITTNASDLINAATGQRITLTPLAPTRITLPNSGNKGVDFGVGGSIAIPDTAAGDYVGTIEITADYE